MELAGRIAVVTGASSGIGEASARALADAGMTVVGVARRQDRLDALARASPGIRPYAADVTDPAQVAALADWVGDRLGGCHVLVNSAGAACEGRFKGAEDVDRVLSTMELNFGGTVRCMAALADLLFDSAPARVINVASVAGKLGAGPPGYIASKFATVGFTEAVAGAWGRRGVAVSQLNPGYVETEGFPMGWLKGSALGRWAVQEPAVVADAVTDIARRGTLERTVPRWYRPLVTLRHVCPPVYRAALRRI